MGFEKAENQRLAQWTLFACTFCFPNSDHVIILWRFDPLSCSLNKQRPKSSEYRHVIWIDLIHDGRQVGFAIIMQISYTLLRGQTTQVREVITNILCPVHTYPEIFVSANFFMRIHLASTRVRRIRSVYPEISVYALQSGNFCIRCVSGYVWTLVSVYFCIRWRHSIRTSLFPREIFQNGGEQKRVFNATRTTFKPNSVSRTKCCNVKSKL